MIKRLSIIMPIRKKIAPLKKCLNMLWRHSYYQHEIILVLDRPQAHVVDWVNGNAELRNHGVKVLTSPFKDVTLKDQFGTAHASNFGWSHAEEPWLMCMDDDMYCSHHWDKGLLRRIRDINMVYVPVNVRAEVEVKRKAEWGEWYHLTYPQTHPHRQRRKMKHVIFENYAFEEEWLQWAEETATEGVYLESCGMRLMGHWMPLIIHRSIFERSGGFDPGVGRDINFDTKLGELGLMKTVVRNCLFLHMKGELK